MSIMRFQSREGPAFPGTLKVSIWTNISSFNWFLVNVKGSMFPLHLVHYIHVIVKSFMFCHHQDFHAFLLVYPYLAFITNLSFNSMTTFLIYGHSFLVQSNLSYMWCEALHDLVHVSLNKSLGNVFSTNIWPPRDLSSLNIISTTHIQMFNIPNFCRSGWSPSTWHQMMRYANHYRVL